ncbi:Protein FAR1-RELATED SEQUENCE [Arachis hypogaea]|nr:Protein FAR1-RELATED SEQUENCE [Arachis hypogaea]
MDDSTSDYQLNQGEVDFEFASNEVSEALSVVDDQFVPKVGMTFKTLEDAAKFYKDYAKATGFSTRVRSTNKKGNKIKNQLITCNREGKWKSKISSTEKTNPTAGLNCAARIYIHTLKDVGAWIISKVVLHHSHPYCPTQAEMLKQYRELSMSVRRTIENNEEADLYEDRHIWVPIYLDHHF